MKKTKKIEIWKEIVEYTKMTLCVGSIIAMWYFFTLIASLY